MEALPPSEIPSEEDIKKAYDTIDRDLSDDVTWSEWQVALAYNNKLSERNLRNVYQFLNLKNRKALKLKHLHAALKPHIQRLKLERGTERDRLEHIIADVCSKMRIHSYKMEVQSTETSGHEGRRQAEPHKRSPRPTL